MKEGDRWLWDMVKAIFVGNVRGGLSAIFGEKKDPPRKPVGPDGTPGELALEKLGIDYKKQPDGTLLVAGNIDLCFRKLTELPDLSTVVVEGNFYAHNNQLTSLKGAPRAVKGFVRVDNNRLATLEGAPRSVGANFWCENNPLTSLEHAPQTFTELSSDLGKFARWEEVPEQLRLSPETRARIESEEKRAFVEGATVLKNPVSVPKPFRFK